MDTPGPPALGKRSSPPPRLGPSKPGPPKFDVARPAPPLLGTVTLKKKRTPWTPTKTLPTGPPYHFPGQKLGEPPGAWRASPLGVAWGKAHKRFKSTHLDQIIYKEDTHDETAYFVMDFGKFLDDKKLRFVAYRIAVIQKKGSLGAPYVCED